MNNVFFSARSCKNRLGQILLWRKEKNGRNEEAKTHARQQTGQKTWETVGCTEQFGWISEDVPKIQMKR